MKTAGRSESTLANYSRHLRDRLWGQTLSLHPHLNCIIRGGGITKNKHWKVTRNKGKFLLPVKALSKELRVRIAGMRKEFPNESKAFFEGLFKTIWVVYEKRPFGVPLQVT